MELRRKEIRSCSSSCSFSQRTFRKHLLNWLPCYFILGSVVFGPSLLFLWLPLSCFFLSTCLHSCCACHHCIYGWGSPLVYYVSVTVILVVGKTHWNILWKSIGNIFSLSFQQNKMTFMYMELDLWIFSDSCIWGIQLIWLNVLILRTIWNWHTDLDAGYLQRV